MFWLLFSFFYICLLVLIGFLLYRFLHLKSETVRKFIHIFTSNWVFILVYKINNPLYMVLGPVAFIFINAVFVYAGLGRYMGMNDRKRDNGLIYYPLAILVLVLFYSSQVLTREAVLSGILIMGWADGMAAFVGVRWGRHKYLVYGKYQKSAEGSLVMFFVSFLIVLYFGHKSWYWAFLVALVSTVTESLTPLGFDNLSVPLVAAFLTEVL